MANDLRPSCNRRAFTTIEFVAVLALSAILAASAALSLGSYSRKIAFADAVRQVEWADALVRSRSRAAGMPASLEVDLARGVLSRGHRADASVDDAAVLVDLPAGVKITRLEVAGIGTGYGYATVPFTQNGQSPSYAMLIADASGRHDWIVVAGLTGQVTHVDEHSIDELLASEAFRGGAGPNAD